MESVTEMEECLGKYADKFPKQRKSCHTMVGKCHDKFEEERLGWMRWIKCVLKGKIEEQGGLDSEARSEFGVLI